MALGCGGGDDWPLRAERGECGNSRWNSKVAGVAPAGWLRERRAPVLCVASGRGNAGPGSRGALFPSSRPLARVRELVMEPQVSRAGVGLPPGAAGPTAAPGADEPPPRPPWRTKVCAAPSDRDDLGEKSGTVSTKRQHF